MKPWRLERVAALMISCLLAATLAACSGDAPVPPLVPAGDAVGAPPPQENVPATEEDMKYADVPPPTPDSILYLIYQRDGDGATSYEIANGAWVSYWHGHAFEIDGKHYFTGFAYATRERFPADGGHTPGPGDRVDLSHATLQLTDPGAAKPWTFLGAEPFIGSFGAYDRGNEVDEVRRSQEFRTVDGRLVLAVPTWSFQSGERIDSFDVFVFNPADEVAPGQKHWTYLGNVVTGGDNSASCGEEAGMAPCVASKGVLEFIPSGAGGLPGIRVERSGTIIEGPGRTRALGASDTAEYAFSEGQGEYRPADD